MSIINATELLEYIDGDIELLQETYDIVCKESQSEQAKLKAACEAGDLALAGSTAHTLKGMLANFLAEAPCQTLLEIELIDKADALVLAQPLLQKLHSQIDRMLSEIRQILDSSPPG